MENEYINRKYYLEKDKFHIVDITKSNCLKEFDVGYISLYDGIIINRSKVIKLSYNDLVNPLVVEEDAVLNSNLYINPEYYLLNQELIDNMLCEYLKNCKKEKISISSVGLINDNLIDAIVSNSNFKEVSLAKYSKEPYVLSVSDYNKFKKANIKVNTHLVCDELKENFDDIIMANSDKDLIGHYKYRDLISKKGIFLDRELTEEELYYLKYINPHMIISLDIENFKHLEIVINKLKEYGKKNIVKIKLSDKNKFNEYIFKNELDSDYLYVETPELESVMLRDYLKFEKLLYQMIKNVKDLSPFEKYIYAYNITKQFKDYKENDNDLNDSRKLYHLLANDYMVCVGFSRLFGDLLDKMGIPNFEMGVSVDTRYDNESNTETIFNDSVSVTNYGHSRRYVHIVDPKYSIDGYYVSDPTWDNDLEHDYYNFLAITDDEASKSNRYLWIDTLDIFNVRNISEYIEKMNRLMKSQQYKSFLMDVDYILDYIRKIDNNVVIDLEKKYEYIKDFTFRWPNDITSLIYDIGEIILKRVNKTIDGDTVFSAVENVYKHSYGYSDDKLVSVMETVRKENIDRQSRQFPTRYKIDNMGNTEVLMNEENKFEGKSL